jgi:DNA-binding NarL/FixJ family response regulator
MFARDWPKTNDECFSSEGSITDCEGRTPGQKKPLANDLMKLHVVERNPFILECLAYRLDRELPCDIQTGGSLAELCAADIGEVRGVLVLSVISLTDLQSEGEFRLLADLAPNMRSIVIAKNDDLDAALAALSFGANGYISTNDQFSIFVEALRFVAGGGTYVAPKCLVAPKNSPVTPVDNTVAGGLTNRELAVIKAIRQGKPNKVIAYELNMCESTVKVHVRHVMKKLQARNRTDLAVKASCFE